jgi:hypothetical protein
MSMQDTDVLAQLIGQRHHCLSQLHALSRQQLDLIDAEEISELLHVLSSKQQWLETLAQIERGLNPFRDQRPEDRRWRSEADRQRCGLLITECDAMFRDVIAQEKQSEARLCVRRDEAATRLQGAHVAGAARGAYVADRARPIGQLDLSSEL